MSASTLPYRARVAIVGGATAGAEAAAKLARAGALCVVFEQNDRPYGKVEDGLPMWHVALRKKEYQLIDEKLAQDGVHYVPRTGIGRDISFPELLEDWGFDLVILAHGAWRDRQLPVAGADAYINRGLVYQNPFIYWFNHYREPGYSGPTYESPDRTLVVGGGLASIDVAKVLQLETTARKLAERGIAVDLVEMEGDGIPATLARHGIEWKDLGLEGCSIYYRRRVEDMPLAETPAQATPDQIKKIEAVRRRILEKAQAKFLFRVEPLWSPIGLLTHGDRLEGLRFARTRLNEHGKAVIVPGEVRNVEAPLTISSIGSIPEPIEGLPMDGELLRLADFDLGKVLDYEQVFGCGNVVTGKGNLVASRRHADQVATAVVDLLSTRTNGTAETAFAKLLNRVRERQDSVGYPADYRAWARQVSPLDPA
jgi:NADPH-dependent glutamate synthase beta subunit-like oxidoreductase